MKSFIYKGKEYNGNTNDPCLYCAFNSISGLSIYPGLCPYHYTRYQWLKDWADKCYPDYIEALKAFKAKK